MKNYRKRDFPVDQVRRILEPGPLVLVSSMHKGETNIMTMGWHTVMEFTPSLIGCVISAENHSFGLISKSCECVINVPPASLVDEVVGIGNCSGAEVEDKFEIFGLTPGKATKVSAPLIQECFANFECRIADRRMVNRYNFFIFEVVKAHVAVRPANPQTLHYHGQGIFSTDGKLIHKARQFTKLKDLPNF